MAKAVATTTTRRKFLSLVPAVAAAALTTIPALAGPLAPGFRARANELVEPDEALLALYGKYNEEIAIYAAAKAAHEKAKAALDRAYRRAFPGSRGWTGERLAKLKPLDDQLGGTAKFREWCTACDRIRAIVADIRATKAESIVGIAIKLTARPMDGGEYEQPTDADEAIRAVMVDIHRMAGLKAA